MLQFRRIKVLAFAGSPDSGDPAKVMYILKANGVSSLNTTDIKSNFYYGKYSSNCRKT